MLLLALLNYNKAFLKTLVLQQFVWRWLTFQVQALMCLLLFLLMLSTQQMKDATLKDMLEVSSQSYL